jgi:hypothetical protein
MFLFSGCLVLHTVGAKETTVKQTSTDVVLSVVFISLLCVGIPEGQEIFLFSVPLFRSYGAHPASCTRHRRNFPG